MGNKKARNRWLQALRFLWWRRREVRGRLRRPRPLRAACAPLARSAEEMHTHFLSSASCRVRFPCMGNKKARNRWLQALRFLWWRRREVRGRLRRPRPLRGARAPLARSAGKCIRISSAPRPVGFDSHAWVTKKPATDGCGLSGSCGGDEGNRTLGLCHATAALSQLSYVPRTSDYCSGATRGVNGFS